MIDDANKQIQCWPTPQIFVPRASGGFNDYARPAFNLDDFQVYLGQPVTVDDETPAAGYALQSLLVNGSQPTNQSDSGNSAYALQSLVAVTAQQASDVDNGNSAYALQTLVAVTAQQRSETDSAVSGYALQSLIVP